MDLAGWDRRYRNAELHDSEPAPLLVEIAAKLKPARALDLACGKGRNALWLAEQGWSVTAIDGSKTAVEVLRHRAALRGVAVNAQVSDLEAGEYRIAESSWDLIAICYYLQRSLFEPAKRGAIPGGILIAIAHITEPGEEPTQQRLKPGELAGYFHDWEILHEYEGQPNDRMHKRSVAEIVARRPQ